MPVSHIGLTVTHLPTSTSFYLSALAPLGYKFIAEHGTQIGFGPAHSEEADFFISQEGNGIKASAAHVAFLAPSLHSVDRFYSAALRAGGTPNGSPQMRGDGWYNAAVLDFDGNSVEVVHRSPSASESKALTWREADGCASIIHDDGATVISHRSHVTAPKSIVSTAGEQHTPRITITEERRSVSHNPSRDSKELIGTLLGVAAGAAVAYAMVKSERDSAVEENAFNAEQPGGKTSVVERVMRVIEAAPTIPAPSARSASKSHVSNGAGSIASSRRVRSLSPPARSTVSHRSSQHRELEYPLRNGSIAGSSHSSRPKLGQRAITAGPTPATASIFRKDGAYRGGDGSRSTLIDTFLAPTEVRRVVPDYPITASPLKATASTHASTTHSARSRPRSGRHSSAPSVASEVTVRPISPRGLPLPASNKTSIVTAREIPLPTTPSPLSVVALSAHNSTSSSTKAKSHIGSVLGRDNDTVAPSDSISCAGSKRSKRSSRHSSKIGGGGGKAASSKAGSSRSVRNVGGDEGQMVEGGSVGSGPRTLPIRPSREVGWGVGSLVGARSSVESRAGGARGWD
ncbi:MAG: hypothetical protein M1836_000073 [Candelina mexicana]|nr:MAG: hypothetical protein M1836_000073 [Candelina mexicana]